MNRKHKIITCIIIAIIISTVAYGVYYLNDYYPSDESVNEYLNGTDNVTLIENSNYLFLNGTSDDTALIFYPGAKVEYTAYLPLLMKLSNEGYDCFLLKMPFNLAIFGKDNADKILNNESYNYSKCYLSGHSLGGIMASSYAKEHEDKITGLILLASYSTEKLENISVLSICASEDKILNKEKYEKAKENMPRNFTEHIVEGGNHGQFGAYANQSGDGIATISRDKQINEVSEEISSFIFSKK